MGLRITTDDRGVKVIRQDKTSKNGTPYTTYSLMVSSKNGEDWVNGFVDCVFPKGTSLENKTVINIKDAFYLVSEYQGKAYPKIFVKDFEIEKAGTPQTDADGFVNVPEGIQEELPFAQPQRG
jgi:hypothetical protein